MAAFRVAPSAVSTRARTARRRGRYLESVPDRALTEKLRGGPRRVPRCGNLVVWNKWEAHAPQAP